MVRVVATQDHVYADKKRVKGEVYQAREMDLVILRAYKHAEIAVDAGQTIEAKKSGIEETENPKPSRARYKRRDMRADS
jgi:uncharacterized protein YycO